MFVLGGLQGLLGWYMVRSGLVDRPDVSQYRLTAHLGLAVVIFGLTFWLALKLLRPKSRPATAGAPLRRFGTLLVALAFVTLLSGGLVAGLDAGLAYNTFPLMDERLIPSGLLALRPVWLNPLENVTMVQFDHRVLALATLAAVLAFSVWALRSGGPAAALLAARLLAGMAILQVALGVSTLLLYVPISLAVLHQAGALVLFTLALWTRFELGGVPAERGT